MENNSRKL